MLCDQSLPFLHLGLLPTLQWVSNRKGSERRKTMMTSSQSMLVANVGQRYAPVSKDPHLLELTLLGVCWSTSKVKRSWLGESMFDKKYGHITSHIVDFNHVSSGPGSNNCRSLEMASIVTPMLTSCIWWTLSRIGPQYGRLKTWTSGEKILDSSKKRTSLDKAGVRGCAQG